MAVGPIEMQGQILRTQDYSAVKHQEDSRAEIAQNNINETRQTDEVRQHNRVTQTNQSNKQNLNSDASEKGNNEYTGDGGKRRREAREAREADGKVFIKAAKHINLSV